LGGGSAWQHLAERIVFKQFLLGYIMPAVNEVFYHHSKMTLRSAKSSDTMKKHGLKKPDMPVNRQLVYI
jgi:hypothetical protein